MNKITGYSLYVNMNYYETYESYAQASTEADRYNSFNATEILPMMARSIAC